MTVLKRVTQAEMKKRTGFGKALGYSFPEEDEILIRKDLPKDLEHEVIAHEEEHMTKGEEGPGFLDAVIGGIGGFLTGGPVGAVVGGLGGLAKGKARDKQGDLIAAGTQAQVDAAARQQAFAEKAWEQQRQDQQHFVDASKQAMPALLSLVGLGGGGAGGGSGFRALGPAARGTANVIRRAVDQEQNIIRRSAFGPRIQHRAYGGMMGEGDYYNINELEPESVYAGGEITRHGNPVTIDGRTGYVEPGIQGRAMGGFMENTHYAGPPPGKPNPPWIPGGQPATRSGGVTPLNAANTTAINPQTGYPNENPGGVEGGYNFMTEPGYQFRFSEGMRALDRGAAARGGLLSGGYGRKAIRYGQGFASNEFSNVYNRIANIAGLGQTAATASGQQGLQGAALAGGAASNAGFARASGYGAQSDLYGSSVNDWANLPWGDLFNRGGTRGTAPTGSGSGNRMGGSALGSFGGVPDYFRRGSTPGG